MEETNEKIPLADTLAVFDFDGTLTTRDTFKEFLPFSLGYRRFFSGLLIMSPILVQYVLRLVSNSQAKEMLFGHYFSGMPACEFEAMCKNFAQKRLDALLRPSVYTKFVRYKKGGADVVVVSATLGGYLRYWGDSERVEVIATEVEIEDGRLTGRFLTPNCYGIEKVKRLKERYALSRYREIVAFGDSKGDRALFDIAHRAYFRDRRIK